MPAIEIAHHVGGAPAAGNEKHAEPEFHSAASQSPQSRRQVGQVVKAAADLDDGVEGDGCIESFL